MNVGLFTGSPEGAGWASIYMPPPPTRESDKDRNIENWQAVKPALKQSVKNCLLQACKVYVKRRVATAVLSWFVCFFFLPLSFALPFA